MLREQGIVFASVIMIMGAVPASAQESAAPLSPVPLFTQMCTSGGGSLSKDSVREISYTVLPQEARQVIGFGGPQTGLGAYEEMHRANVPNRVLQVGARGVYLLLPAPGKAGAMATSCAVVWRGQDFAAARSAVFTISAMKNAQADADFSPIKDAHLVEVGTSSFSLSASEMSGWTMLREAPAADAATPSAGQSSSDPGLKTRQAGNGETIVKSH
jgi:hypothetical protein